MRHGGDVENVIHVEPEEARPYWPYVFEDDLFVGFDNKDSITEKAEYVDQQELGGLMFWDLLGDNSRAQNEARVASAQDAYPAKSLVYHIANELERLDPVMP